MPRLSGWGSPRGGGGIQAAAQGVRRCSHGTGPERHSPSVGFLGATGAHPHGRRCPGRAASAGGWDSEEKARLAGGGQERTC